MIVAANCTWPGLTLEAPHDLERRNPGTDGPKGHRLTRTPKGSEPELDQDQTVALRAVRNGRHRPEVLCRRLVTRPLRGWGSKVPGSVKSLELDPFGVWAQTWPQSDRRSSCVWSGPQPPRSRVMGFWSYSGLVPGFRLTFGHWVRVPGRVGLYKLLIVQKYNNKLIIFSSSCIIS